VFRKRGALGGANKGGGKEVVDEEEPKSKKGRVPGHLKGTRDMEKQVPGGRFLGGVLGWVGGDRRWLKEGPRVTQTGKKKKGGGRIKGGHLEKKEV